MDSFISWIGGKKILRKKIIEQFPEHGTYERYVEVFGGAGWVLFSLERHAQIEVYNDINGNLINLFRCIKYHSNAVQEELRYTLNSREQFFDAKEQLELRGMTDIQKAARFYILIKESFASDLHSYGLQAHDIEKATEYLDKISKRLRKVVIENLDFQRVLHNYDRKNTLFYLDPPYYEAEKYYSDRFIPDDHIRLKESLDHIKGKFVLSYNDCEYIRKLYNEYKIIEIERANNLVNSDTKPRFKELIIKNF